MTNAEYKSNPRCPKCQSTKLEPLGCIAREWGTIHRPHVCRDCSHRWSEVYEVAGFANEITERTAKV